MNLRPAILVFVQYFRPAYRAGGAARSIANLVDHLGDEFDFHVVCRDRDLGDSEPFALSRGQWTEVGKARVWYEPLDLKYRRPQTRAAPLASSALAREVSSCNRYLLSSGVGTCELR